ncbi:MAG: FAD-dependent oxidoreductase [Pseudomonadota bacterium]
MPVDPDRMKWWGWGDQDASAPPAEGLFAFLESRIGPLPASGPPLPRLEDLTLRPAFVPEKLKNELEAVVGGDRIRMDHLNRVRRAVGRSYRDLIRVRLNRLHSPPDAIIRPKNEAEVSRVLEICQDHGAAVVPFGGGSSVVGGLEAAPEIRPLLSLDLTGLADLLAIDAVNQTATAQAGIFGPDLEAGLARQGLTLGHFPQSFEFSTLGGWIATRGAGHKSTRYGKIEDMVLSVRVVGPGGEIRTPMTPAQAAGGDIKALLIGSEGALGVITEAVLRVRPLPEREWFDAYLLPDFGRGLEAVRMIMARGLKPSTIRLSDDVETSALMAEAAHGRRGFWGRFVFDKIAPAYLKSRGIFSDKACLLLVIGEDAGEKSLIGRLCRENGGVRAGSGPARLWNQTRYTAPYLRDDLIGRGLFIETMETAAMWDRLPDLYRQARAAVSRSCESQGIAGLCLTHLSHAYREGANLYFTVIAPQRPGREEEQWFDLKTAVTASFLEAGGALSHHHGVGRDHKPWLETYLGPGSVKALRAAKAQIDPWAVLNPGVLFDPEIAPQPRMLFQPFSFQTRADNLDRLNRDELLDVLVVGGGIVGSGVAWDAALRGLSVGLVEKNDFANGASGKSSRMIHGGLRYLKKLEVKLVRESLTERHHLLRMAPGLVRPDEHIVPIYKEGDSRTFMHLGLWVYDNLAGSKGLPAHRTLSAEEILDLEPGISSEGLVGGLVYFDGLTDDARLTLETAKAAARAGALIANHVEAVEIAIDEQRVVVRLRDALTGRLFSAGARVVVNAGGAWSDRIRSLALPGATESVKPAKGIHLAYPRDLKPINRVVILKGSDGRPLFAVPSGKMVYVGATDSFYQGDLDQVRAEAGEVEYLLEAVNSFLAGPPLTREQVAVTWAGIRPLAAGEKNEETKDISREHEIKVEAGRLVTIRGGKLTTFRSMAAQAVDKVMTLLDKSEQRPSPTDRMSLTLPVPGRPGPAELPPAAVARIMSKYGAAAETLFQLCRSPWLSQPLDLEAGLRAVEVYWAVFGEMALTLSDAMVRRLGLTHASTDSGMSNAPKAAALMAQFLGWSREEEMRQLQDYREVVESELSFKNPDSGSGGNH